MENKITALFFVLFISFSLPVYALNSSTNSYHRSLEKCWQKWDTSNAKSDTEILNIIDATSKCMQDIGHSIIENFYTKNQKQMKEDFDHFVQITQNLERDIYTKNNISLGNAISIKDVTAAGSSLYILKMIIEDMMSSIKFDTTE